MLLLPHDEVTSALVSTSSTDEQSARPTSRRPDRRAVGSTDEQSARPTSSRPDRRAVGPTDDDLARQTRGTHVASTTPMTTGRGGRFRAPDKPRAEEKRQASEVSLRRIARLFAPYRWSVLGVVAIIVASSV